MGKLKLTEEQKLVLTKLSIKLQVLIMEFAVENRADMSKLGNLYVSTINVGVQALMNAISNMHIEVDILQGSLDPDDQDGALKKQEEYCGNILGLIRDQAAVMAQAHSEGDLRHTIQEYDRV